MMYHLLRVFPSRMTAFGFKQHGDVLTAQQPTGLFRYLDRPYWVLWWCGYFNLFSMKVASVFLKISRVSLSSCLPRLRLTSPALISSLMEEQPSVIVIYPLQQSCKTIFINASPTWPWIIFASIKFRHIRRFRIMYGVALAQTSRGLTSRRFHLTERVK